MILHYTESELLKYDSIYLINYVGYDFYTIFNKPTPPYATTIDKLSHIYNSPLAELEELPQYTDGVAYTCTNIRRMLNGTTTDIFMVWALTEQVSPSSYVRLSGIKIKDSPDIYPLKIDVYNERSYIYISSSGYCYMLAELCKLENSAQKYKSDIRAIYIDRIKRIFRELSRIIKFSNKFYLSELEKYIDTQVADNIASFGSGVISEQFYKLTSDLITGRVPRPYPTGEAFFKNVNSLNVKATVDAVLKPLFLSSSFNSKLFNYVKNGVVKLDMRKVAVPNAEFVPPYRLSCNDFDYIEGDYLLTPNICSSINNFNLDKYGHLFVNLNTDCNSDILQIELMFKIESIFSNIIVVNAYICEGGASSCHRLMAELCEELDLWVTGYASFRHDLIYYIQITKTFMGDVVVTMFDEDKRLMVALYYNSIIEVLNRPTLFIGDR